MKSKFTTNRNEFSIFSKLMNLIDLLSMYWKSSVYQVKVFHFEKYDCPFAQSLHQLRRIGWIYNNQELISIVIKACHFTKLFVLEK